MEQVANIFRPLVCLFLLSFTFTSIAQQTLPPLERTLSITFNATSYQNALKEMETLGTYRFAYPTDVISSDQQLTRSYTDKTTREILDDIFQGDITYKERGNYILLRKAPVLEPREYHLEGYISDRKTQQKLPFATVYDSTSFEASISDAYGHYSITLKDQNSVALIIKKYGYHDTTLYLSTSGSSICNVQLRSLYEDSIAPLEEKEVQWFDRLIPTEEQKANIINFTQQLKRKAQFSIVPFVGTNGKLSPTTSVDYSFNLLGGFNGGVRKAEIGGLFNIVVDSVEYFQAAGLFNVVGGHQTGAQLAGVANVNGTSLDGAQVAGFTNITRGKLIGAQVAGFSNLIVGDLEGVQVAGFMNVAQEGKLEGAQIASFMNVADHVKGNQIAFINFNNSIEGVPIGFFSFSKKGLHQLELSSNEFTQANVAFKTGTNQFYNSFLGGVRLNENRRYWSVGYGIGSSVRTSQKTRIFFDLQTQTVQRQTPFTSANLLTKLTASFQWKIAPAFAIAAGPSFNLFMIDDASGDFDELAPYQLANHTLGSTRIQSWVGGHVALRLF